VEDAGVFGWRSDVSARDSASASPIGSPLVRPHCSVAVVDNSRSARMVGLNSRVPGVGLIRVEFSRCYPTTSVMRTAI
jgi:hypothetical protein